MYFYFIFFIYPSSFLSFNSTISLWTKTLAASIYEVSLLVLHGINIGCAFSLVNHRRKCPMPEMVLAIIRCLGYANRPLPLKFVTLIVGSLW